MRIEYKDLRHGTVRLRCENLDDIWYVSQVLVAGDLVKGKSLRRIKDKEDTKSSGGERKTVTLSVRVEKAEFKAENNVLRVSGIIEETTDDVVATGSHHTLNVDSETVLTIIKEGWSKTDLDRLNDAVKGTLRPKVVVVSLDEGDATVALIRDTRTEYYELDRNIGGKYELKGRDARKHEFYRELTMLLGNIMEKENAPYLILSGPGFEKGNYHGFLKENYPDMAAKCALEDTGMSGRNGVQEVLKRDAINRALEEVNSVRDIRYMEDVLKNIGKDTGLATYGKDEVSNAVDSGAVEVLLVTDGLFFSERAPMERLMNKVRESTGKVHIIGKESEAGQKLGSLGGLAAKLRYRLY